MSENNGCFTKFVPDEQLAAGLYDFEYIFDAAHPQALGWPSACERYSFMTCIAQTALMLRLALKTALKLRVYDLHR
jgi:hypothetical protein